MRVRTRQLTAQLISRSPEICKWLEQFGGEQGAAVALLQKLIFISNDAFTEWLKQAILHLCPRPIALLAVRKLDDRVDCLWEPDGRMKARPSHSLGSEDLVNSVVAMLLKSPEGAGILDHPSIEEMKERRVHDIVLLDDSIGSGQRVRDFLMRVMNQPNIYAWWNSGWIRIHVVAFARSIESETVIMKGLPGSDHSTRKYHKSSKFAFIGELRYLKDDLPLRWGHDHARILAFCDSKTSLSPYIRRGVGHAVSNVVFYHSVPDNIPGVLWSDSGQTIPLFPRRSISEWLPKLLDSVGDSPLRSTQLQSQLLDDRMISILRFAKKGLRRSSSIARSAGLDPDVVKSCLNWLVTFGLLSGQHRISEAGRAALANRPVDATATQFNRSLYIPSSWCAGRATAQPFDVVENGDNDRTDSIDDLS